MHHFLCQTQARSECLCSKSCAYTSSLRHTTNNYKKKVLSCISRHIQSCFFLYSSPPQFHHPHSSQFSCLCQVFVAIKDHSANRVEVVQGFKALLKKSNGSFNLLLCFCAQEHQTRHFPFISCVAVIDWNMKFVALTLGTKGGIILKKPWPLLFDKFSHVPSLN